VEQADVLPDIEAIKRLKARYCRYLDAKDWTAWRELFTDDFVSDLAEIGGTTIVGADEFVVDELHPASTNVNARTAIANTRM